MDFIFLVVWMGTFFTGNAFDAQDEGSNCRVKSSGENGICVHIQSCPAVLTKLRSRSFPQHCGFNGTDPIVCCPSILQNKNIETKFNVGIKSQEKCAKYTDNVPIQSQLPGAYSYGGVKANAKEFPHMAHLGYDDSESIKWLCGGSLISEDFILTAAHCLVSRAGPVKYIKLGDLDVQSNLDDAQPQNFSVKATHIHPEYKRPSHYNDIALIQLDRSVEFTLYVKPACLQTKFDLPNDIFPVATGWGQNGYTEDPSPILMKVTLSYYDNKECQNKYASIDSKRLSKSIDHSSQICAGGIAKIMDTCPGDSGGPLQINYPNNEKLFYVIGITSFGKGCGVARTPGIYTRVSRYVPWIENIVWPEVYNLTRSLPLQLAIPHSEAILLFFVKYYLF